MENYDERTTKRVKEKNVYLLHLDTPRILIITSVALGLLIIAFLFGTNMKKDKDSQDNLLANKDPLMELALPDKAKGANPLDNNIPNPLTKKGNDLNLPYSGDPDQKVNRDIITNNDLNRTNTNNKPEDPLASDILTRDNMKEIVPPTKEILQKAKNRNISKRQKKKSARKRVIKERKRKSKKKSVVEVAADTKPVYKEKRRRKGYAIQVASLDNRSKARKEINRLKKLNFDAYINKSDVDGRNYYRVRIGPISSKKKAIRTLNDVQQVNRYNGSYMIRE